MDLLFYFAISLGCLLVVSLAGRVRRRAGSRSRRWMVVQVVGVVAAPLALLAPALGPGFSSRFLLIAGGGGALLAAWPVLQQMVLGLVVMAERTARVGDVVSVEGFEGRIEFIGLRSARLRRADGSMVILPISALIRSAVIKLANEHGGFPCAFEIIIPAHVPDIEALDTARRVALLSPWVAPMGGPDIVLVATPDGGRRVRIRGAAYDFSVREDYASDVTHRLLDAWKPPSV
jgi:small-conductance mechanosensitive channel